MGDDIQKTLQGIKDKLDQGIHRMRAACSRCGSIRGVLKPSGNQDCVFCLDCGKFQYNAPRTETGRERRTLQTVRGVPPSQRSRVLERAHARCELCAAADKPLTIAHVLSIKDGFDFLTDAQLNSDENLMSLCDECNSGYGQRTVPLWLFAAILYRRTKP